MFRPVVVALVLAFSVLAAPAQADVLLIERTQAAKEIDLPKRGESMTQVEARFGAPRQKHATVGGASAAQPPITRWDYAQFSVYFEHSHVVSAVLTRSSTLETGPKAVSPQQ